MPSTSSKSCLACSSWHNDRFVGTKSSTAKQNSAAYQKHRDFKETQFAVQPRPIRRPLRFQRQQQSNLTHQRTGNLAASSDAAKTCKRESYGSQLILAR